MLLPATPAALLEQVIEPALHGMPVKFDSLQARVMLVAIALQESGLRTRQQDGGPAHGLWQFEENGCEAVLVNPVTAALAAAACRENDVGLYAEDVYAALLTNDELACVFARLMLYAVPHALPELGDEQGAWTYYVHAWGVGKPRPDDWPANYAAALKAVTGQ